MVHDIVKHVLSINTGSSIEEPKTSIPYHVFLNHRGTDVKNTLASHLYYRLIDSGWRVFFDKEEAQKGRTVNSELEKAIKFAYVHVVIFSKRYAESEWCLDELLLMVKSQSIIIPVFYDVKRSDIMLSMVGGMNGVYVEALRILKEKKTIDPETHKEKPRYDSDTIEIWKGALMEATKTDGFDLETYDGDEGQLVDNVVLEVDKQMKQKLRTGTLSRCG